MYNDCRKGSEFMDKEKEKKRFRITKTMGEKDYIEALKLLSEVLWSRILVGCLFLFVICITICFLARMSFSDSFVTTILLCLIVIISSFFQRKRLLYKIYQDTYQHIDFKFCTTIDFYDSYLITKSEYLTTKILYTKLTKIKEIGNYFYLYSDLQTVIISKKECTDDVCSYIRSLPAKKYIYKNKKYSLRKKIVKDAGARNIQNEKGLSILFWFLFGASILSLYGAFFTQTVLSEGLPARVSYTTAWVAWLWLLFPILSLVLGILYSRYRFCSKNIVIGVLCSLILIVTGCSFFLAPKPSHSFSEIKPYQDILQVDLPKDAIYYHDDTVDLCQDSVVDISILYVAYPDDAGEKLAQNIKNSKYWISSYESEKLYDIMPYSTQSEYEDDYYLIFNKNSKQYNSLPDDDGKQHFIVMKYDSVYYRLYIYQYTLNYVAN